MKTICAVIIVLCVVTTLVLFIAANRVDYQRRLKGWNGVPYHKFEYTNSKKLSRFLRTTCIVLLSVAGIATYGFFVFG